jgi:hypothetical protein
LCNKNQLDAQFILSLFRQSTSTCFEHICIQSSGGILYIYIYIYNKWYVLCFSVDCWSGWDGAVYGVPSQTGQQTVNWKHNTYQLYIYSILPYDGLQICPKYVEADWRNKLRINCASSWFLLQRYIEMHGQWNIKVDTCLSLLLVQCQLIEGEPDHNVRTKVILNIMTSSDDDNEVMERVNL